MKNKMGRPQLVPGESKSILMGARFSPDEARTIHAAIRKSKKIKSEWIRENLLHSANSATEIKSNT